MVTKKQILFNVFRIVTGSLIIWMIIGGIGTATGSEETVYKFRSDLNNSGVYDDGGTRPKGELIWKYTTEGPVASSPTVANGVVYVGSYDGNIYALYAGSGALLWKYKTNSDVFSSPAVANGVVYVGSDDERLYALDAATGERLWSYNTGVSIQDYVRSSPAVANDVLYFASYSNKLYAWDLETGAKLWEYVPGKPNEGTLGFSSPAVSNGFIYVGCGDQKLHALDAATGKLIWKYTTEGPVASSPAVANGVVYFGNRYYKQPNYGKIYALDAETGNLLWDFLTGGWVYSSPAVANGVVYVGSDDGNLYALDAMTGDLFWDVLIGDRVFSSPAVANGVVYVGSDDGLYALDAGSGALLWKYTTEGSVASSPAVANGVVYVGSDDGNLYAIGSFSDNTTNILIGKSAPQFQENTSVMNYTLSYRNQGSIPAENVVLKDYLPHQMEYLSGTGNPDYDSITRTVTWSLGSISPYTDGSQTITVRIPASVSWETVLNNTANISTTTKEVWYNDNTAWALTTVKKGDLPPNVSLSPFTLSSNGIPSVHYQKPLTFSYYSCPNATSMDIRIHINDGEPDIIGSMIGGPPNWHYSTTFYPRHGVATITYAIHGCEIQKVTFQIYIDPAGYIYDTITGERIAGATVWLQWPDEGGNWTNVPTGLIPAAMQPDENPLLTNVDGQYQWDVIEGSYRIFVEANGYESAVSSMVNIPPPVFDLNVGLTPLDAPPMSVTNIHNTTYLQDSITWIWNDPSSTDYDHVMIYLNGAFQANVTKGVEIFTASSLTPAMSYEIGTRTVGTTGLINSTWVNHTAMTAPETPIPVPPASVTNLHNTTYLQNSITWAWTDPSSTNFDHAMVYLNGVFQANVTKGAQTFTASSLTPATSYMIGTHTVGTTGLINSTWVNHTAVTAPPHSGPVLNAYLNSGWNIFSTPILLDQEYSQFPEIFSGNEQEKILIILGWDGSTWYIPAADKEVKPLDAFYVKVSQGAIANATIVPSKILSSPPAREVTTGINLIGFAPSYDSGTQSFYDMPLNMALISIEYVGGSTGYTMVISPSLNQPGWTYAKGGQFYDMVTYKGYWVIMENGPDTLYGFSTTPISN